jgi:hypothetical protein
MLDAVISGSRAAGFAVGHGVAEPGDAAQHFAVLMDARITGSGCPPSALRGPDRDGPLRRGAQAATESTRRARRARQGWTLRLFETRRGRMLGLLGLLADADAALEGRFAPGDSAVADCPGRAGAPVHLPSRWVRTHQAIAALDRALAIHAACGASWDLAVSAVSAVSAASASAAWRLSAARLTGGRH